MVNRIMEIKSKTAPQLGCSASGGRKIISWGIRHQSSGSDICTSAIEVTKA